LGKDLISEVRAFLKKRILFCPVLQTLHFSAPDGAGGQNGPEPKKKIQGKNTTGKNL